ncbi:PREDICTED: glycine-rich cell wall structural protein 1.8-like [Papilio polytes]|uniref:glycine-rich cell wall structural protein 1.8-like n=1 Tax=Papilio polytes TaxID=76194 RepID=UPI0006763ACE|nr:PREDICTED: glycine-rich cell wall structural protein 1.8-like [Papilio polytes]
MFMASTLSVNARSGAVGHCCGAATAHGGAASAAMWRGGAAVARCGRSGAAGATRWRGGAAGAWTWGSRSSGAAGVARWRSEAVGAGSWRRPSTDAVWEHGGGCGGATGAASWRGGAAGDSGRRYLVSSIDGVATRPREAVCRLRNYACSMCKQTGHLRRACPKRSDQGRGERHGADHVELSFDGAGDGRKVAAVHHLRFNQYKPV